MKKKLWKIKTKTENLGYVEADNKSDAEKLVAPFIDTDYMVKRFKRGRKRR